MIFVRLLFIVCYLIQLAIHGDAKGGESLGSSEGVNNERIASATELNVTVNILLLTVAQKGGIMDKKRWTIWCALPTSVAFVDDHGGFFEILWGFFFYFLCPALGLFSNFFEIEFHFLDERIQCYKKWRMFQCGIYLWQMGGLTRLMDLSVC